MLVGQRGITPPPPPDTELPVITEGDDGVYRYVFTVLAPWCKRGGVGGEMDTTSYASHFDCPVLNLTSGKHSFLGSQPTAASRIYLCTDCVSEGLGQTIFGAGHELRSVYVVPHCVASLLQAGTNRKNCVCLARWQLVGLEQLEYTCGLPLIRSRENRAQILLKHDISLRKKQGSPTARYGDKKIAPIKKMLELGTGVPMSQLSFSV